MPIDAKRTEYSITWTIYNFLFCHQDCIFSPNFTHKSLCPDPFYLILYPDISGSEDGISCIISKCGKTTIYINIKMEIIGPSGNILGVYNEENASLGEGGGDLVGRSLIEREIMEINKDFLTVRCRMSLAESIVENTLNCVARTKIIVNHESLQLRWTGPNELRTLFESNEGEIMDSLSESTIMRQDIHFPNETEYKIFFNKRKDDIEIKIDQTSDSVHYVECKISLLDLNNCKIFSLRDRHLFSDYDSWTLPTFLTISKIRVNREKFIKNDCMIILCELFCFGGIESQEVFYDNQQTKLLSNHIDNVISNHSLQSDIRKLFFNKSLCDVKLRVNGEIVEAHKFILMARSPVMQAMFQQDMLETQTGIVHIKDIDISTLKTVVTYMHTDAVEEMDYDDIIKVLLAADKYEVLGLKEKCASLLRSEISERNVCEVASLADMIHLKDLRSFALDFIVDHHADIFILPEWIPWATNNIALATEVFQKLTDQQANLKSFFVKI